MTPGLKAAALLDADGRVVAGDAALARAQAAEQRDTRVVRGARLTLVARAGGPVLRALLEADMATALAAAEATEAG
jgi:hypothetical protein